MNINTAKLEYVTTRRTRIRTRTRTTFKLLERDARVKNTGLMQISVIFARLTHIY